MDPMGSPLFVYQRILFIDQNIKLHGSHSTTHKNCHMKKEASPSFIALWTRVLEWWQIYLSENILRTYLKDPKGQIRKEFLSFVGWGMLERIPPYLLIESVTPQKMSYMESENETFRIRGDFQKNQLRITLQARFIAENDFQISSSISPYISIFRKAWSQLESPQL